jgi:hypothetical protein
LEFSGLLKAHEGPLRNPDQYWLVCMCSPSCYLSIPNYLRLKTDRF